MEVDNVWICVVHYLACLCPTVGSVLYHIFMNHVGGEHVYDTLLSVDMVGVCLVNTLGIPFLTGSPVLLTLIITEQAHSYFLNQHQAQLTKLVRQLPFLLQKLVHQFEIFTSVSRILVGGFVELHRTQLSPLLLVNITIIRSVFTL